MNTHQHHHASHAGALAAGNAARPGASEGMAGPHWTQHQQIMPQQAAEFRRWFGPSKVVDDQGEPLVVYHGTARKFTRFDGAHCGRNTFSNYGRGFYFTPNRVTAAGFAGEGGLVMSVHLRIVNPVIAESPRDLGEKSGHASSGYTQPIDEFLTANGYDGVIIRYGGATREIVAFSPDQIRIADPCTSGGYFRDRAGDVPASIAARKR